MSIGSLPVRVRRSDRPRVPIEFLYFDLGKVLVHFDLQQALGQIAAAAGVRRAQVASALLDHGLQREFELGRLTPVEFFDKFRELTGTQAELQAVRRAATEIFWLNESILPVVGALRQTRRRMGILSNTCVTHWQHCLDRFHLVRGGFELAIPSFEVGLLKPSSEIYRLASERAGVAPEQIFFTDDIAENVAGAQAAGFDAVQYTSARQLARELRLRGVPMNL